jgi:hypothetical protein
LLKIYYNIYRKLKEIKNMIKVEIRDEIHYFANRDAFGQWLVDNDYCRTLEFFTNDEYSAWEIVQGLYSYDDIKAHWWNSEVFDEVQEWFDLGWAEVV